MIFNFARSIKLEAEVEELNDEESEDEIPRKWKDGIYIRHVRTESKYTFIVHD